MSARERGNRLPTWPLLVIACLALATPAHAGTKWVGAQLHFPVPGRDISDRELGVDAGVTFTMMHNAYVGLGADVIHHYWPASAGYEAAFDRYLRSTTFETLGGSHLAPTALQMTGHVKFFPLPGQRYAPWMQVGLGAYRLNRHLESQRPEGTYAWVLGAGVSSINVVPGGHVGVGLDFHVASPVALGVDATFHYLYARDKSRHLVSPFFNDDLPDFSAFTIGTRVLFAWD